MGADLGVLLLERADFPDYWQSVTGSQEPGETLAEAVVRALGEQAGVAEAICGPFIGWAESIDTDTDIDTSQSHTLSMYFRAVLLDSTTQPASQAAEVRWIPSWDAAELGLADGLAEFLGEHGLIETLI